MAIPEYAVVGSESGVGMLTMKNGDDLEVIIVKLGLTALDTDDPTVITINTVFGREDAEVFIEKLKTATESVAYVAEQINKEETPIESQ